VVSHLLMLLVFLLLSVDAVLIHRRDPGVMAGVDDSAIIPFVKPSLVGRKLLCGGFSS